MSKLLSKEQYFGKTPIDYYGLRHYAKYKKLTPSQRKKIEKLKYSLGKVCQFKYRGKVREMILMAVSLPDKVYGKKPYNSYPYDFRLNYIDYKTNHKRDWDGFWTMNIDNLVKI